METGNRTHTTQSAHSPSGICQPFANPSLSHTNREAGSCRDNPDAPWHHHLGHSDACLVKPSPHMKILGDPEISEVITLAQSLLASF